jgi:hypothetical protein
MTAWINRFGSSLRSVFDQNHKDSGGDPDLSRRTMLTGVAAVIACGIVATALPTPAAAQIEFRFGDDDDDDDHSRRRSRDDHSRRRSRDNHSRRRSRDHGRRRSRRENRDWNEDCFPTPFGWMCL